MRERKTADNGRKDASLRKRKKGGGIGSYLIAILGLLLAAVLCWRLPQQLLEWQDEKLAGKSDIQPAQPVAAKTPENMALVEKMNLLYNSSVTMLTVSGGKRFPAEKEAVQQAKSQLNRLAEAGVLTDYGTGPMNVISVEVAFAIDRDDSERSMLLWRGLFECDGNLINWYMDDETGILLGARQETLYIEERQADIRKEEIYGEIDENGSFVENYDGEKDVTTKRNVNSAEGEQDREKFLAGWADYLGCVVEETGRADEFPFGEQPWTDLIVSIQETSGISFQEAYYVAGQLKGYSNSFLDSLRYAVLGDGEHTAVCFYSNLGLERCFGQFIGENSSLR